MIENIGICGTGKQAEKYILCLRRLRFNVTGIKGSASDRIGYLNQKYNVRDYATVPELINAKSPDLLIIASKPGDHLRDVIDATENDIRYIIIEKPLTTSVSDAKEIKNAVLKRGTKVSVAYPLRYLKAYRTIKKTIDSKELGELVYVGGNISFPRTIDPDIYPYKWWIDSELSGGGSIFQVGIHWINFIFSLIGYGYELKKGKIFKNKHDFEDTLCGIWKKKKNSCYVELQMTSCIPMESISIVFGFEKGRVMFFGDYILKIKNCNELLERFPYVFQFMKRSYRRIRFRNVNYRESMTLQYLKIALNNPSLVFNNQSLEDSVHDIEKIYEINEFNR
jgi:predicted dehydrogenase